MSARKLLLLNRSRWLRDISSGEMLAWYRGVIADGKLVAYLPRAGSTTPQVKGSAFTGAGTGACTGLLTTDTITSQGTVPTCTVNGTLTISATCWDIYVHRDGVLWAYWPGINVGATFELDASGNGHHLYLTTTTIVEVVDGTGTNWANERGFTVADGSQYLSDTLGGVIDHGSRIPSLIDSSGCAAYSITGEDIPDGIVSLWNAATSSASVVGPNASAATTSQQPNADGSLVDWPVYVPREGIRVQPAYAQLAQNSKFLNAVAGSPGTGPDNWTYTIVDSPTMAVSARTVGNSLTLSGTASRGYLSMSQAMAALSVYTFSFNAVCDGALQIDEIQYCSLTGGTIVVSMDGVVVADENAVPAAGVHAFSIKVTAGAVGDTATFRFGLGASAVATGSVTVYEPMLAFSSYVLPYAASGVGETVPIASTAATSAGNGLAIPMNLAMKRCFGCTVVAVGDSITAGAYPTYLGTLRPYSNILSSGVSGDTSALVLARLTTDVLAKIPEVVTLLVGINDLQTGVALSTIQANILAIISAVLSTGSKIVISTVLPWKGDADWTEERQATTDVLNAWIMTTIAGVSGVAVVDGYSALEDPAIQDTLLPLYDSGDHLHPSATDGASALADVIAVGVEELSPDVKHTGTFACLVWVGSGNNDGLTDSTVVVAAIGDSAISDLIYMVTTATTDRICRSREKTNITSIIGSWGSGEIHLKICRPNAELTQIYTGNRRYSSDMVPIDANIVWSAPATYTGRFNMFTHLRMGFNTTAPIGVLQTQLWNRLASDAEVLSLLRYAI